LAALRKQPDIYADVSTMRKWCDSHGDFTLEVKNQLEEHFRRSTHIKSLVSVPLFKRDDSGHSDKTIHPIGVLNLHSDRPRILRAVPDMFGDKSLADKIADAGENLTLLETPEVIFLAVMRPFEILLVELLVKSVANADV
jgi:GAF domain-containing protein